MPTSIPISGLNTEAVIQSQDFIPIVNSASLTTYRATIQSFGNWMLASGSASSSVTTLSSSYAITSSWSPFPLSSSWSSQSLSSSWPPFISNISSSWSSQSLSASYLYGSGSLFGTASWANTASYALNLVTIPSFITFLFPSASVGQGTSAVHSATQFSVAGIAPTAHGVILQYKVIQA